MATGFTGYQVRAYSVTGGHVWEDPNNAGTYTTMGNYFDIQHPYPSLADATTGIAGEIKTRHTNKKVRHPDDANTIIFEWDKLQVFQRATTHPFYCDMTNVLYEDSNP
jgi:hypothetical protein